MLRQSEGFTSCSDIFGSSLFRGIRDFVLHLPVSASRCGKYRVASRSFELKSQARRCRDSPDDPSYVRPQFNDEDGTVANNGDLTTLPKQWKHLLGRLSHAAEYPLMEIGIAGQQPDAPTQIEFVWCDVLSRSSPRLAVSTLRGW